MKEMDKGIDRESVLSCSCSSSSQNPKRALRKVLIGLKGKKNGHIYTVEGGEIIAVGLRRLENEGSRFQFKGRKISASDEITISPLITIWRLNDITDK